MQYDIGWSDNDEDKKMLWIKNMDESWMMNNDVTTCRIIHVWIWVVNGRNDE